MKIINASSQPHPKAKESSLRRQPTFRGVTTGFPSKWRPRNECRNSLLMTCHYPGLLKVFDWLKQVSIASRPIRSTAQIWVVTRHHYWIFAFLPQTSFWGETRGGVAKCRLFSHGTKTLTRQGRLFDSVGPGGVDYADIEKIARLFLFLINFGFSFLLEEGVKKNHSLPLYIWFCNAVDYSTNPRLRTHILSQPK